MKRQMFFVLMLVSLVFSVTMSVQAQGGIDTSKWYHIIAKHSGKCLDLRYANRVYGERLIQYTCHSGDNQKFQFETASDGYYRIVVGHSRQCVDQLLANYNDGGLIGQYPCHTGQNQQWLPSYSSGYYQFNVRHSSKNMDVQNASYSDAAQLIQYLVHGGDNQLFSIEEVDPPCTGHGGDGDADSYCADVDCDDNDPSTYPGAPIYCESGFDRNCNSWDDYDECYSYCCTWLQ